MKIITNNVAYVQKIDLINLHFSGIPIPSSINKKYNSIYERAFGRSIRIYKNDSTRYEFVKIEEQFEIEYFKNLDWVIDYNEIKDLSEQELIMLEQITLGVNDTILDIFNAMSKEDKKNCAILRKQCNLLDLKLLSLKDILLFKQGHIEMELPDDVDYPFNYEQEKDPKKFQKSKINKK